MQAASGRLTLPIRKTTWWDPKSGEPFEFCYAYASRTSMGCRRREWRALSLVAPSLRLDPNAENYPLSVKPDKKLSVKDVLNIFRDYYGGTPYDMTQTITVSDREGKMVKSPIANPFMSGELRSFLKIPSERTIACARATYVTVTQSRNWLPDAVGGVVWLGYDNPCTTPHIPFYCGITTMPESYMVDGRAGYRDDCAWWVYRKVSQLTGLRYQEMVKDVSAAWGEIEEKAFADQKAFEESVVLTLKSNPVKAAEMLTNYSVGMANNALDRFKKLENELWTKHTRFF
jgi:dipeptidase